MTAVPFPRGPMGPSRLMLSKPVIAAIEGPAVGGGMELALWCDCRVMAEGAYMGIYNRRWGVPLSDGGTVRLPRVVGRGRALELIMTGRKVEAEIVAHRPLRDGCAQRAGTNGRRSHGAPDCAISAGMHARGSTSVYSQHGLPEHAALQREWTNSTGIFKSEGAAGAARFAKGAGRHGEFSTTQRSRTTDCPTDCGLG